MIKTFHNNSSNQPKKEAEQSGNAPSVKVFDNVAPSVQTPSPSQPNQSQPNQSQANQANQPTGKAGPSVLFSNQVTTIQNDDILLIDETLKRRVDAICDLEFQDVERSNKNYMIINNIKEGIKFHDPSYQIEFGHTSSKKFQEIQGHLSDYAKIGKVDRILDLGKDVIDLAKDINIDIFNPDKLGTKILKVLGNKQNKVRKIKYEFDRASDLIDAKVNRVFDNLNEMTSTLKQFKSWSEQLSDLYVNLQLGCIALKLKIEDEEENCTKESNLPAAFQTTNRDAIQRWERKRTTLATLSQSVGLTFPQIELYRSNLLMSFERLEEIKVNVIQVWKQQFLTVIAVDESNDSIMYHELNDVQERLIQNIKDLK